MSSKSDYEKFAKDRSQFLQRARHNALLTIPSLMPLEGQSGSSHLVEPYQGLGSQGVTHLSSRISVAMLPAGRPYMRFDLPAEVKMQSEGEVDAETEKGLSLSEQLVQSEVERAGWRDATLQSIQQLLVAGNVCEHLLPDNSIRVHRLDSYVVRRDFAGRVMRLIIKEEFPADAAPVGAPQAAREDEKVELYTDCVLSDDATEYTISQFWGNGDAVDKSIKVAFEDMPYIVLRWSSTPGEDYGRSKVEEHIADLRSLDALEKAQLEIAAMASRNFIMIAPGANASSIKNRLADAINGDVVVGDPESVDLKSFDNIQGAQIVAAQIAVLRENLARAFLLLSGAQRDAERVTAVEIERDVAELEAALGGTFSSLSQTQQERRTVILVKRMKDQEKLPSWPDGMVIPVILTGLEALSRERDVGRALQAAQINQAFGEDAVGIAKVDKILGRAYAGLGFADSIRTPEETQQFRQQKAEQEALAKGVGAAIPGVAREVAKQEGEQ